MSVSPITSWSVAAALRFRSVCGNRFELSTAAELALDALALAGVDPNRSVFIVAELTAARARSMAALYARNARAPSTTDRKRMLELVEVYARVAAGLQALMPSPQPTAGAPS